MGVTHNMDEIEKDLLLMLRRASEACDREAVETHKHLAQDFMTMLISQGPVMAGELAGPWVKGLEAVGGTAQVVQNRFHGVSVGPKGEREIVGLSQASIDRGKALGDVAYDPDRLSFEVRNRVSYALAVEEGSRPHPIDAAPGGFLVFYSPRWQKVAFARHVNHPGTQGIHLVHRVGLQMAEKLQDGLRALVGKTARAFLGIG